MKIIVKRIKRGANTTLSELYIDGDFVCYGLEDTVRDVKIKGQTAIPAGHYCLKLRNAGAMHGRYKKRFPDFHQGMLEMMHIPNYSYVYIHIGNYFSDTSGCLLVGQYHKYQMKDYAVFSSTQAYISIYKRILEEMKHGEVWITIE